MSVTGERETSTETALKQAIAKLDKVATWLERNAAQYEANADTRFTSLNDARAADARNYRAAAADIRKTIAECRKAL